MRLTLLAITTKRNRKAVCCATIGKSREPGEKHTFIARRVQIKCPEEYFERY
jgi:hypothetical protein